MKIGWQMDYLVRDAKSGIFKYRRRVPPDLQPTIGKREIIFSLKTKDEGVALTRYGVAHSKAEAILGKEVAKSRPQIIYEATLADLQTTGLVAAGVTAAGPVALTDDERFNAYTAAALSKFDAMTPVQLARPLSRNDAGTRIVMAGFEGVVKPKIRLAEAIKIYLNGRQNAFNASDLAKQCELVRSALAQIMEEVDPLIEDIDDDVADAFRNQMVRAGKATGTVRKRITTIRAVLTFVKKNKRMKEYTNPFVGIEITNIDGLTAKERRDALSLADIKACVPALAAKGPSISDLWVLMMFTGARPKELIGLLWAEVDLDHPTPQIEIKPNSLRRLKTMGSQRKVPLVGPALEIMKRRWSEREDRAEVFPQYAGSNGPNAVSALQVQAMKQAGVWVKILKVPYSLRHSVKDWMRRVAPQTFTDVLQGHASGGSSADYGSDDFLDMMAGHMTKALKTAGVWGYPDI